MSPFVWRKNLPQSSSIGTHKKRAAERNEIVCIRSIAFGVAMSMSYTAFASSEQTIKIIEFDIPQQNADISLTEFAQQANITLIFPYDIASEFEANPLEGEHSIQEAIGLLLEGTPLKVLVGENGQLTIATDSSLGDKKSMYKKNQLSAAVAGVISTLIAGQAVAQDNVAEEEVLVTGIRGSLQRAMDVKRDTGGVVDAISAEDMGKFPDTNLAESLQRITGVSINRVNGEGSEVTVRGFSGDFNLVTLNGRQMPAANVGSITGNPVDQGVGGTSRSFDFSNLASEGVSGLQVYKTGRANSPTGGIGATINVQTIKPLDGGGTRASFGGKLVDDQSGDDITPEVSGLFSWANDSDTFGVAVFGSYQERDSGSQHMSVEQYQLNVWDQDLSPGAPGIGKGNANLINNPGDGNVVALPTNIGLGLNEDKRERVNSQVTLQYSPSDTLTVTADMLYAANEMSSVAIIDGIWFARTFSDVEFDGNPVSATPIRQTEDIDGGKDFFFQNLTLATKDELSSFGFNVDWQASDNLNLRFDVASSEAESSPNGPYGRNVTRFNVAGANAGWQTADFTGEFPQASIAIDDSEKGNNNGVFDIADLGTQVARTTTSSQVSSIDQLSIDGTLEVSDDMTVDFGLGSLTTEMQQNLTQTQDALGDWGVNNPGEFLGREDLIEVSCTGCAFDADISGVEGAVPPAGAVPAGSTTVALGSVSFRGDSVELLEAFAADYGYGPETENLTAIDVQDNFVEEEITSAYVQLNWDLEVGGLPANILTGLRYENTDVTSTSSQAIPDDLSWVSDNDFVVAIGNNVIDLSDDYSYSNFLPSIDFSVDLTDDVKARASLSKTIARPQFSDLFTATTVGVPDRPIFNGGLGSASFGNVTLDPLESTNFDLSLEWYYDESSFLSVGYYSKDVANFVGVGQVTQPLFDLRDPTSGQAGTRSGDAVAALRDLGVEIDDRNFFTMTAVLDNPAAFPNGAADFETGQAFADAVFAEYSVSGNADDPFYQFEVAQPINDRDASIDGFEIASQHFFGESGFGYQANYTTVDGDIGYDNGSNPAEDQFALTGLSDSANFVLIYENYGWSARVAYNWRESFLDEVNRAASGQRNPLYIDDFTQIDFNVSYEFSDNLTVSLDGININEEGQTQFGRSENQRFFVQELAARYVLGVRYTF